MHLLLDYLNWLLDPLEHNHLILAGAWQNVQLVLGPTVEVRTLTYSEVFVIAVMKASCFYFAACLRRVGTLHVNRPLQLFSSTGLLLDGNMVWE